MFTVCDKVERLVEPLTRPATGVVEAIPGGKLTGNNVPYDRAELELTELEADDSSELVENRLEALGCRYRSWTDSRIRGLKPPTTTDTRHEE